MHFLANEQFDGFAAWKVECRSSAGCRLIALRRCRYDARHTKARVCGVYYSFFGFWFVVLWRENRRGGDYRKRSCLVECAKEKGVCKVRGDRKNAIAGRIEQSERRMGRFPQCCGRDYFIISTFSPALSFKKLKASRQPF